MITKDKSFPTKVSTSRIISDVSQLVDWDKVEEYSIIMANNDIYNGHHGFPEIIGQPMLIDESFIGQPFLSNINDGVEEYVTEEHIGEFMLYLSDGHHRTFAAIKAGINYLEWDYDYNTRNN